MDLRREISELLIYFALTVVVSNNMFQWFQNMGTNDQLFFIINVLIFGGVVYNFTFMKLLK